MQQHDEDIVVLLIDDLVQRTRPGRRTGAALTAGFVPAIRTAGRLVRFRLEAVIRMHSD